MSSAAAKAAMHSMELMAPWPAREVMGFMPPEIFEDLFYLWYEKEGHPKKYVEQAEQSAMAAFLEGTETTVSVRFMEEPMSHEEFLHADDLAARFIRLMWEIAPKVKLQYDPPTTFEEEIAKAPASTPPRAPDKRQRQRKRRGRNKAMGTTHHPTHLSPIKSIDDKAEKTSTMVLPSAVENTQEAAAIATLKQKCQSPPMASPMEQATWSLLLARHLARLMDIYDGKEPTDVQRAVTECFAYQAARDEWPACRGRLEALMPGAMMSQPAAVALQPVVVTSSSEKTSQIATKVETVTPVTPAETVTSVETVTPAETVVTAETLSAVETSSADASNAKTLCAEMPSVETSRAETLTGVETLSAETSNAAKEEIAIAENPPVPVETSHPAARVENVAVAENPTAMSTMVETWSLCAESALENVKTSQPVTAQEIGDATESTDPGGGEPENAENALPAAKEEKVADEESPPAPPNAVNTSQPAPNKENITRAEIVIVEEAGGGSKIATELKVEEVTIAEDPKAPDKVDGGEKFFDVTNGAENDDGRTGPHGALYDEDAGAASTEKKPPDKEETAIGGKPENTEHGEHEENEVENADGQPTPDKEIVIAEEAGSGGATGARDPGGGLKTIVENPENSQLAAKEKNVANKKPPVKEKIACTAVIVDKKKAPDKEKKYELSAIDKKKPPDKENDPGGTGVDAKKIIADCGGVSHQSHQDWRHRAATSDRTRPVFKCLRRVFRISRL